MQTMSPLDASFLHVEDAVTHVHIGSANPAELIAYSLALRAASPYEAVRTLLAAARGPRRMARQASVWPGDWRTCGRC